MSAGWGIDLSTAGVRWSNWMLDMSWQVLLLAAIVWCVAALSRRSSARFRHLLWLLVFVKLLLPPSLSSPWSLGSVVAQLPIKIQTVDNPPADSGEGLGALGVPGVHSKPSAPSTASGKSESVSLGKAGDPRSIAMGIWATVAIGLFGVMMWQNRSYSRKVRSGLRPVPERIAGAFEEQQNAMGTTRNVTVALSDSVSTPGVFGWLRPVVLWPAAWEDDFTEPELANILAHELAHVKRGDVLLAWFAAFLSCLYWFHPVVWAANRCLRREREMACDDLALSVTRQESRVYASTVLHVAEAFAGPVPVGAGLLGLLELSDNLLQRVRSIGDAKRPRTPGRFSFVVLLVLALLLPMGPWTVGSASPSGETAIEGPTAAPTDTTPAMELANAVAPVPAAPSPPTSAEPIGVALLEFGRVGSQESLGEVSAQMLELVSERLANAGPVRLVERDKIANAFQEVKLSETGMVDAGTAVKLGKVVGAKVLLVGRVMKTDSTWTVTTRLIDTQTSEVSAVKAEAQEADGVQMLAQRTADAIVERLQGYSAKQARSEPASSTDTEIAQLRQQWTGKQLPRVVVKVPESHIGTWVPDPAGETEIISALSQVGFRVVDVSTFMKRPESSSWLDVFFGPAREREGTEVAVREGFRGASDIMHDQRIDKMKNNADIFIIGEAFSEYIGENYGFKSCRARIEVKAIDTATEQIVAAVSQHASAADLGELVAGKAALRNAGSQLGLDLAKQLAAYWSSRTTVQPQ